MRAFSSKVAAQTPSSKEQGRKGAIEEDKAQKSDAHVELDYEGVLYEHPLRSRLMRSAFKSGARPCRTAIAAGFSTAITKNASTGASVTTTASSFADWSSFASIFDEVTLVSIDVWMNYDSTGMASANTVAGAFAWDGIDATAPTTSSDIICYPHHVGPFVVPTGGSLTAGSGTSFPMLQGSTTGMWHLRGRPAPMRKRGIQARPEAANLLVPLNTWIPTSTSGLNFGYIKAYFNNPNAVNAGTLGFTVRAQVVFRMRNG